MPWPWMITALLVGLCIGFAMGAVLVAVTWARHQDRDERMASAHPFLDEPGDQTGGDRADAFHGEDAARRIC